MENLPLLESNLTQAEAALERGELPDLDLLESIDSQQYPLAEPELIFFWRDWLMAEFEWWKDESDRAFQILEGRLRALFLPSASTEWLRIKHLAASLGVRISIGKRDFDQAEHWLAEISEQDSINWETSYLSGMLSWAKGDLEEAHLHLEESVKKDSTQSRVRFELAVLKTIQSDKVKLADLDETPVVHDAMATSAIIFFRAGQTLQAKKLLELLDEQEMSHSLRLLWPATYRSRIQQGLSLRAHLAETMHSWPFALKFWRLAHETISPPPALRLVDRAHRLAIMGLCLEDKNAIPTDADQKKLYDEFHLELSLVALRPLTGDAMFYRGFAAHQTQPDRVLQDGRALLRQGKWLEKTRQQSPSHLIIIGDWLLQAGLIDEALRAYQQVADLPEAQIRILYSSLIKEKPLTQEYLLKKIETVNLDGMHRSSIFFMKVLGFLAGHEPDLATAQSCLELAIQASLPLALERIGRTVLALAEKWITKEVDPALLNEETYNALPTLHAGLDAITHPINMEILVHFQETFGAGWQDLFPTEPLNVIGYELQRLCSKQDFVSALEIIELAEKLGIAIPVEWYSSISMTRTIQLAMQGNLEAAEETCAQVLTRLQTLTTTGRK